MPRTVLGAHWLAAIISRPVGRTGANTLHTFPMFGRCTGIQALDFAAVVASEATIAVAYAPSTLSMATAVFSEALFLPRRLLVKAPKLLAGRERRPDAFACVAARGLGYV